MADLCLANPSELDAQYRGGLPIEFQRHAGRAARYCGFGEQAITDYQVAIDYAEAMAGFFITNPKRELEDWKECIRRDIAQTYLTMGACESAGRIADDILEQAGQRQENPFGSPPELDLLAEIAKRQGRYTDSVQWQWRATQARGFYAIPLFLQGVPELSHISPDLSWEAIVRHPDVRRIIMDPAYDAHDRTNVLRNGFCRLAHVLRVSGQLDEAIRALETAASTPWRSGTTWRENLDLYVDRERAWLALDRGQAAEALERGRGCLDKYVMSPGERIELLDLCSRALERLGDLQGALDELQEAIDIVEDRRANLIADENKQFFVAGYARLYRRALELVVRGKKGAFYFSASSEETARARQTGREAHPGRPGEGKVECPLFVEESFEWSERVKARAMLDSLNRYGRRMAVASATGDTQAVKRLRDLAGQVVSVDRLRKADWWPKDAALLEYTYGKKKGTFYFSTSSEETARARQTRPEAQPGRPGEGKVECPLFLWVVTGKGASFRRLEVGAGEVDKHCTALADALARFDKPDESWVQPASWLYEHLIAPVASELSGVRRLVIVGDGKLCTAPFEVFVTARQAHPGRPVRHHLLIEDYCVAYAPSATVLASISQQPRPQSWDYALWAFASTQFKDPNGQPKAEAKHPPQDYTAILRLARSLSLADLPNAKREVQEIGELVEGYRSGAVKVFVDESNMKVRLLDASEDGSLRSVRFLHFATHAVNDPRRPYLSGLVLCPPYPVAPHSPAAKPDAEPTTKPKNGKSDTASTRAAKPWGGGIRRPERLTVGELAALDLGSDLVVLSACRSLGGWQVEGDWLYGLTRALLVAGSSGVLCTTADTADQGAVRVGPAFYHVLLTQDELSGPGMDVAQALRELKRSWLISRPYGHPSNWASWVYHGRTLGP